MEQDGAVWSKVLEDEFWRKLEAGKSWYGKGKEQLVSADPPTSHRYCAHNCRSFLGRGDGLGCGEGGNRGEKKQKTEETDERSYVQRRDETKYRTNRVENKQSSDETVNPGSSRGKKQGKH